MSTLRAKKIFQNSALTLIAVESVDLRRHGSGSGGHLYMAIEPFAVVVRTSAEAYALDMEGNPVNLDQLRREAPELDAIIMPS